MGVRFQCPNGHKLHVKTELAGRRGICPECGAKFVVPSFSGGRAPEDTSGATPTPAAQPTLKPIAEPEARSQESEVSASAAELTPRPMAQPIAQPIAQPVGQPLAPPPPVAQPVGEAPTATAGEPAAWYVRPASGGQFGPATTEVFHEWIAAGRVAADSWVWRSGWADWKAGNEALALVADRPPLDPAAAMAAALDDRAGVLPTAAGSAAAAAVETTTAEQRRLEIKRRKQRMRMISGLLALVALAMLMALVVVLVR